MAVTRPELKPRQKIFTHQDFLDGKCTADGFPLDKPVSDAPTHVEESKKEEKKVENKTEDKKESE